MIPNNPDRGVRSSATAESTSFGISYEDESHIMGILRDTLYSDKILAVLREYASNAWDAHRAVGKGQTPIEITLPTWSDLNLVIRDHGPGLSHDDVFCVYTQYGRSTKRGDDLAVGMLGIGSKSGFAYSDSFTVTSFHGGFKRVYVAVLDETDKGQMKLVHEEPSDETGIEIKIAVRSEDLTEFRTKAERLYQHFDPQPAINTELPTIVGGTALDNGTVTPRNAYSHLAPEWIAVMGCVPYGIQVDQLLVEDLGPMVKTLARFGGVLRFDIGALQIAASREDLRYTKPTKAALTAKIIALIDDFVVYQLAALDDPTKTSWDKRGCLRAMSQLDLPVPELWKEMCQEHVKVESPLFHLCRPGISLMFISTAADTKLWIDDTSKALEGYCLNQHDYVVRGSKDGMTPDEIRVALDAELLKEQLDGVSIALLSTRSWYEPEKKKKAKTKRGHSPKHRVQTFKLVPRTGKSYSHPYSDHWEVQSRVPTDDDVFVVIENFKVVGDSTERGSTNRFFDRYQEDANLAALFDVEMPAVYGYKNTAKKPVDKASLRGTPYGKWREKKFIKLLSTPENLRRVELLHWMRGPNADGSHYYSDYNRWFTFKTATMIKLVDALSRRHPVTRFVAEQRRAVSVLTKWDRDRKINTSMLAQRLGATFPKSSAATVLADLYKAYPIIELVSFDRLTPDNVGPVCDYLKLVDAAKAGAIAKPLAKLISISATP